MKKILLSLAAMIATVSLSAKAPIVGVSGYVESGTNRVNTTYTSAVRLAGGVPLIIPVTNSDQQIEAVVAAIDALVMTGGSDFDPLKWFGEEPLRDLGEIVPTRDDFDIKLVRAAVKRGIPVLGICRGEQLFAVAFGGSLWQDIPSQIPTSYIKHRQGGTTGAYGTHSIKIEKGSFLEKALGSDRAVVNSFHHQAVKDVPQGFKVVATSPDGIVEALERVAPLKNYPDGGGIIIGVQFHPEALCTGGETLFANIFKLIVDAAR